MKYDDLDKTKDLFDIKDEVPSPIDNIETEGVSKNNLTQDLDLNTKEEEPKEPKKKKKQKTSQSLKDRWLNLAKWQKVLIIIFSIIILFVIVGLIVFKALTAEEKDPSKHHNNPVVIVEKENYIYEDGTLKFIDEDENELGTYECQNKQENLCYIVNYNDEDDFDGSKNVYEDESLIERRSKIYNNKYVFIYDNKSTEDNDIILYNIETKKEEGKYVLVKGFSDTDYVIVKNSKGKYGTLELGAEVTEKIPLNYDYIGMFNKDSNLVVKTDNKYFIYDRNGTPLSTGLEDKIKSYNNNYIVVANNKDYKVYNYTGEELFTDKDTEFEYISLLDNYAVLIKDGLLYIRDYENNKYNEDGIKLNNDNYNTLNVYDKNKRLIETKSAYDLTIEDNVISISYKNKNSFKSKLIDTYEGKISSTIPNLNYFDGNLYFYLDEEKTELLGKYPCSNKNNITKDTTLLENCVVATEEFYSQNEVEADNSKKVGWVPIFNGRFVFVNDSISSENTTIVLYDLKDKKVLSKYSSVDAGSYIGESKVTYAGTEEAYIMAKNKSNKYGMIRIGTDVASAIPFNYAHIERLKEYYVVKESSGTYALMDNAGQILTDKYGYRIVDYVDNYLKVRDNDKKCYIYNFEGDRIDDTGYLDIFLYEDYYVVITQNYELNIGEYEDSSFSLRYDIELSEDYKDDFTVTKNSNGYTIKIKSTNKTYHVSSSGSIDED